MEYPPIAASLLGTAGAASARDLGDSVDRRVGPLEQRPDLKAPRLPARAWADSHGHTRAANRLEVRGDAGGTATEGADDRPDRRGDRFARRWDRRH